MATKKVISVIGYIDVDLCMTTLRLPDPGESLQAKSYTSSPGGKGANAAVAAFRSSHVKEHHGDASSFVFSSPFPEVETEVRMVGAVGDDAHGAVAKDNLAQNGVNIRGVRTFPGEVTGVCFAMIDAETGENRLLYTPGATDRLLPEDFATPEQLGCGVRPDLVVSQLEVRVEAVERLLRTAHEAGIDVLLNAAPARQLMLEVYQWVTHLIVNETEAAILTGVEVEKVNEKTWHSIAQEFLEDGVKNVVITLASRGAYYANAQDHGHVQAEKVTVVDSTGAGDTFVGACASEYLRQKCTREWRSATNWDIKKAVVQANKASAHTICKIGAQSTIPWADEVHIFARESTIDTLSRLSTDDAS